MSCDSLSEDEQYQRPEIENSHQSFYNHVFNHFQRCPDKSCIFFAAFAHYLIISHIRNILSQSDANRLVHASIISRMQ